MIPLASGLLQLLGGSGAPAGAPASGVTLSPGQVAGSDFSALLQQARTGGLASGRQVTVGPGAGVKLTLDQLQRIANASDAAEAQGATRALVLIDGMALRVDLTARQITGAVDLKQPGVLTNIDALVSVPSADPNSASPQITPLPRNAAAIGSPSLLKALAGTP